MTTVAVETGNHDGHQVWSQRSNASGTSFTGTTIYPFIGPHYDDAVWYAFFCIFKIQNVSVGQEITSASVALRTNNAPGAYANHIYVAVENNLDPTGTGAVVNGTLGSQPWQRLGRQSAAVTLLGARCGPTHTGNLATTGVHVRDTTALIKKAFVTEENQSSASATSRDLGGGQMVSTCDIAALLQPLVDDENWNETSQYVLIWFFADDDTGTTFNVGNLANITWATGTVGSTGYFNGGGQLVTYNAGSQYAPVLTYVPYVPPQDADVTCTAPSIGLTPNSLHTAQSTLTSAINYTNGTSLASKDITTNGSRTLDLHLPQGTAPDGGWPLLIEVHGGFFTGGSRTSVSKMLVAQALARNIAVAVIDYRLTEQIAAGWEFLASGNEASFPLGIHDLKVAIAFFRKDQEGANTYNCNVNRTILVGYSAGTQICQFAAFTQGDTSTYNGVYPGSWTGTDPQWYRPAHVGRSNVTSYPFDFTQNGDANINDFTVKGLFALAGVGSMQKGVESASTPDLSARAGISEGRRCYVSRTRLNPVGNENNVDVEHYGELDIDKYINPAEGSPTTNEPYQGKGNMPVPDFPIGWVRGTTDILVTKAAGYDPVSTALVNIGYIDELPATNETNATGLSYYEVTGVDHENTEANTFAISRFVEWLDAIDISEGETTDISVTAGSPSLVLATGTATVTNTSDVAITAGAPNLSLTLSTATITNTSHNSATLTAPAIASNIAALAITNTSNITVSATAPTVGEATGTTTIAISPWIAVATATVAFAPGTATVSIQQDSSVTCTAPAITLETGPANATGDGNIAMVLGSPAIAVATAELTTLVVQDHSLTPTAALLALEIGTITGSTSTNIDVAAEAPTLALATAASTDTVTQHADVTLTAPSQAFTTGNVSISGEGNQFITASAPELSFTAATAVEAISRNIAITATAPHVTLTPRALSSVISRDIVADLTWAPNIVINTPATPVVGGGVWVAVSAPVITVAPGSLDTHIDNQFNVELVLAAATITLRAGVALIDNVPIVGDVKVTKLWGTVRKAQLKSYVRKRNKVNSLELSSLTKEHVDVTFVSKEDPTAYAVSFAITTPDVEPAAEDWHDGEWTADSPSQRGPKWYSTARVLLGDTNFPLSDGSYLLWLKISGYDDAPVKKACFLAIT